MNRRLTLSAYLGVLAMTLMFIGLWPLWNMLPPPDATLTADQIAAFVAEHRTGILVGSMVNSFAVPLICWFIGGLTAIFRRMEGEFSPLTDAFLMVVVMAYMTLYCCLVFLIAAAYRPELSPEIVRTLVDIALVWLVFPGGLGIVQFVIAGIIILRDKTIPVIFPRWVGYLNIWVGVLSAPSCFIALFKNGPFAWNGILAFWLPLATFGVAVTFYVIYMLKAAKHPGIRYQVNGSLAGQIAKENYD
jgi:hypothetical protein